MADLNDLVAKLGQDMAYKILSRFVEKEAERNEGVLTIVVNKGVHHLPMDKL